MRYVVTGGTGFIGRRVVTHLLDHYEDANVWVPANDPSAQARFGVLAPETGAIECMRCRPTPPHPTPTTSSTARPLTPKRPWP